MNIAALLAGDMVADVGMKAASTLLQKAFNNNSGFSSILGNLGQSSNSMNIEEMNLSKAEETELQKIRELAMNKGLTDIEVQIDGSKFKLNVKENTLTAVVS
jgi:hypothetical protein